MKTLLLLAVLAVIPVMGQEQPRPDLTDPTVLALQSYLPNKKLAKVGKFLTGQHRLSHAGEFLVEQKNFAAAGDFLGTQKQFSYMSSPEALLAVKRRADRPNYPGNSLAKDYGGNVWLVILQKPSIAAKLLNIQRTTPSP